MSRRPVFPDVALTAEQAAYERGYSVFLCNTKENPRRDASILDSLDEKRVLCAHPELTALFCNCDLVAVGVIQPCAKVGRRGPDDRAIVGFDDILLAGLVTPPLTTCHVDRYELGARAMRLLLDYVDHEDELYREIALQSELVVRGSAP